VILSNNKSDNISNNQQHIIVTASTSPKRINDSEKIIKNILEKQTIKPTYFYLNIPYIFKRTGEKYDENKLNDLKNKYSNLKINRCEDLGPVTKMSETLNLVTDPNTIIIIVDDDIDYPNTFIENLVKIHKENNNCVIANSIYQNNGTGIDIVEGFKGICFKRSIFKDDFNDFIKRINDYVHCYKSDDYVISRYLKKNNIEFKKPDLIFETKEFEYGLQDDALHKQDNIQHNERYMKCRYYADTLDDFYNNL